jgi:hypothetical protein
MAGSNFNDPKSNDLAKGAGVPAMPGKDNSEAISDRPIPGVGGQDASSQATPEAKRAGYGYSFVGEHDHPTGGHNIDARNQYTVKMPRGSSL